MLTFRRIKEDEKSYAISLARDEINIEAKRLDQYHTYLIYHNGIRIGFVSYGFRLDKTIYIYILAFEKHAQRQGHAGTVFEKIMNYGLNKYEGFRGLSGTVHKVNEKSLNAVRKHGFIQTNERKRYFDFIKPVSS